MQPGRGCYAGFSLALRVWPFGMGINTFTFRCGQTTRRTTEFVSSILNSLPLEPHSSTPSPSRLVDSASLSLYPLFPVFVLSPSSLYPCTQLSHFPSIHLLSVLLMLPDDKATRLDYLQTWVQVVLWLCEALN